MKKTGGIALIAPLATLMTGALLTTASAVAQSSVPVGQMSRYCAGEASATLRVNPQVTSTEGATRSEGRYVVRETASGGRNSSSFECLFDHNGVFERVVVTGGANDNYGSSHNQSSQQEIPYDARTACLRRFGGGGLSRVTKVSALRPGFWEVMMENSQSGRSVACTVTDRCDIEDWLELNLWVPARWAGMRPAHPAGFITLGREG